MGDLLLAGVLEGQQQASGWLNSIDFGGFLSNPPWSQWLPLLFDFLTILFLFSGAALLWLNLRPRKKLFIKLNQSSSQLQVHPFNRGKAQISDEPVAHSVDQDVSHPLTQAMSRTPVQAITPPLHSAPSQTPDQSRLLDEAADLEGRELLLKTRAAPSESETQTPGNNGYAAHVAAAMAKLETS